VASIVGAALLLLGLFVCAFTVQPAKAAGTIYINADGSITPVTANITTSDKITYTFTGNNYLPMVVNRSNIVVNGNGYTLQGAGSSIGISLAGMRNVTLRNSNIYTFVEGVYAFSSSKITITSNFIVGGSFGVYLQGSSKSTISSNHLIQNSIVLNSSPNNTLSGNAGGSHMQGGGGSIHLIASSNNVLSGNSIPVGTIVLDSSFNNTLSGNSVASGGSSPDIVLNNSNWNNLTGNSASGPGDCIDLSSSANDTLCKNVVGSTSGYGISLYLSSFNTLLGNNVSSARMYTSSGGGVNLNSSVHNVLQGNNVLNSAWDGIYLGSSAYNTISGNTLSGNSNAGIDLYSSSDYNVLSANNVTANVAYGVILGSSLGNWIFHNNFVNNTHQASGSGPFNTWDDGYPAGGNYWNDYKTRYPNATQIDGSGIWNLYYVIGVNNTDNYPLMTPWARVETRITPAGSNVTNMYATGAVVTFLTVTSGGITTLAVTQPPSTALTAARNSVFVSFQTTAVYQGNVALQFKYDPSGLTLANQQAMRIWLWDTTSNAWRDITTRVNTTTHTVYGVSPHLSCFGITCTLNVLGGDNRQIQTVVQTPSSPPAGLPTSLEALEYYNITTTTQYVKPVTVRLAFNATVISPQQALFLQMWLWNTTYTKWVAIPTTVDTVNNVIYGTSPHLSCFGITTLQPFPQGIAMLSASCSKTVVGQGYNVTIDALIKNVGTSTQSFTVFVYANGTVIYSKPISGLPALGQMGVAFNYTASLAYGNYSISACGQPINWVKITIPGDANGDGIVNIMDVGVIAAHWLQPVPLSAPPKLANADVNCDGIVNIMDVGVIAVHWLQTTP
jgi:parallel beta-helix repeat protein